MAEIKERNDYDIIDLDDLPRWDEIHGTLKGSQKRKAEIIVKNGCVQYDKENKRFKVFKMQPYNREGGYRDIHRKDGELRCPCQWNTKNNLYCSHILAVLLWLKQEREWE